MKHKNLLIAAFALVALAQLLVPYRMISHQANFALSGNEFKFKVRHNSTGYSIRGNYLWLRFDADKFKVYDRKEWENSQRVFVTFNKDSLGFAQIQTVSKEKPADSKSWVKARAFLQFKDSIGNDSLKVRPPVHYKDSCFLQLTYPFSNYYIGDTEAGEEGKEFLDKMNNSGSCITLQVYIRENQFLAGELMVDSVSFREFVKGISSQ